MACAQSSRRRAKPTGPAVKSVLSHTAARDYAVTEMPENAIDMLGNRVTRQYSYLQKNIWVTMYH